MPRRKAKRGPKKAKARVPKPAKPIESFTGFSRLPAELQQIIWKEALPVGEDGNGRRMLKLNYEPRSSHHPESIFVVDKRKWGDFVTFHEIYDIGLSAACKYSRDLWLKTFTNEVVVRKGIVRYNDATIIYIDRLNHLYSLWKVYTNRNIEKYLLPSNIYKAKRLVIAEHQICQRSVRPLSSMLSRFENLESLASIKEMCWSGGNWDKWRWGHDSLMMEELKQRLRFQRSKQGLEGSFPKIEKWNRYHVDGRETPEHKIFSEYHSHSLIG